MPSEKEQKKQQELSQIFRSQEEIMQSYQLVLLNSFKENIFDPEFQQFLFYFNQFQENKIFDDKIIQKVENIPDFYKIKIFNKEFCQKFVKLLEIAQKLRLEEKIDFTKPNTMNNYGFTLAELNLQPFMDQFLEKVLSKLGQKFIPNWSNQLDQVHAFTIRYQEGEDVSLDSHMDLSEITLNICLGTDGFKWGKLLVQGQRDNDLQNEEQILEQEVGYAYLHVGQHLHGALPLQSGQRTNLVFWGRSLNQRSSAQEIYYRQMEKQQIDIKQQDEL